MLACEQVSKQFEGTVALDRMDLQLERGEIVGLIGPNGSGKTTLVNVISGFYVPDHGRVLLDGRDVTGRASHRLRQAGISRTFQNLRLFDELTVFDNVLIGCHLHFTGGMTLRVVGAVLGSRRMRARERAARDATWRVLRSVGLEPLVDVAVGDLSYGMKKRVELARALVVPPTVLLLDEPTAGLSPEEASEIDQLFGGLARDQGLAVLLIEHRLEWVMGLSDRVVVLDAGRKLAEGRPDEVSRDAAVTAAYVGGD